MEIEKFSLEAAKAINLSALRQKLEQTRGRTDESPERIAAMVEKLEAEIKDWEAK